MANFHEIRFPTAIALHSSGGPERKTEIVTLGSGYEERNAVWANSRRRYDVGYGVKTLDDMHAVIAFFEARLGRLYGFRFKDFSDFKSCPPAQAVTNLDQTIAIADGAAVSFCLSKTYSSGAVCFVRAITKPVSGSVIVAVNGRAASPSIDCTTGVITFASPPPSGATISAGFEFDVPVRFDNDALSINLAGFAAGEIPSIPLIEVLL